MASGITFICPSYNHEKYIGAFIESVLAQTCPSWELIIIDDCSRDGNLREVERFTDERIRTITHPFNMGIQVSIMEGVEAASYDIVALIASDDMLMPQYVEKVLALFAAGDFGVLYTPLQFIDHEGTPLNEGIPLPWQKSQLEIFVDSFLKENQLPSPGMAMKKGLLLSLFPLHTGLLQYHDWQLHMLLMYRTNIFLCPETLVWYRQTPGSACKPSIGRQIRSAAETDILMDTVMQLIGHDTESFLSYFKGRENPAWPLTPATVPLHLGWIAMQSPDAEKRRWAAGTIISLISRTEKMQALHDCCGFTFNEYLHLPESLGLKSESTFENQKKRLKRQKKLWRAACIVSTVLFLVTLIWNIL